jgi:hypothetical protein
MTAIATMMNSICLDLTLIWHHFAR